MASVHASVASTSNPLNIMPPDFFNSLIGSPSMKDAKEIDVVDHDMINSNSNNDKSGGIIFNGLEVDATLAWTDAILIKT